MVVAETFRQSLVSPAPNPKTVLVSCLSHLEHDPRVMREIEWLLAEGFIVETLGEGKLPSPNVKQHHEISPDRPKWTRPRLIYGLLLFVAPNWLRFRLFFESRIPAQLTARYLAGDFDLVVLNDLDLIPWAVHRGGSRVRSKKQYVHLDLHEYHTKNLPKGAHWRFLMNGFWRWLRSFIASPGITSRSVVAPGIGKIYEQEFGIDAQATVMNAPPFEELTPTYVDPEHIELLYHGLGMWERGLRTLVLAMVTIEPRFHLKLMLTGRYDSVKIELEELAAKLGLSDRILFAPPVAMKDVAKTINSSDLEIIFYEPSTPNLKYSLPNKFFESIQGRLALAIGESPSMSEIVKWAHNGTIIKGWTPNDLARGINALTAQDIWEMKLRSHEVAGKLSMEGEGDAFIQSLKFGDES